VGAQSTLGGHQIFALKIGLCIKNQQNARILHDSCPKYYQNTRIFMIFARKFYKIPEFYMIFARKMPEFYVIIARKIFFSEFYGVTCPPSPTPMVYLVLLCSRPTSSVGLLVFYYQLTVTKCVYIILGLLF